MAARSSTLEPAALADRSAVRDHSDRRSDKSGSGQSGLGFNFGQIPTGGTQTAGGAGTNNDKSYVLSPIYGGASATGPAGP